MKRTALSRKGTEAKTSRVEKLHDGAGFARVQGLLEKDDTLTGKMNFIHNTVLEPGASIGVHRHDHGEEFYYILSGKGTMILDGKRVPVEAGDITAVGNGGSHGLENGVGGEMRIVVFEVGA